MLQKNEVDVIPGSLRSREALVRLVRRSSADTRESR